MRHVCWVAALLCLVLGMHAAASETGRLGFVGVRHLGMGARVSDSPMTETPSC